jgi:hypothetical protein
MWWPAVVKSEWELSWVILRCTDPWISNHVGDRSTYTRKSTCFYRPRLNSQWLFLISNFCRVLCALCFLLGNSPASEFYMPTFRNTLSVPSSYYLPMKMEETDCSETSAYKIQTPANYPEENIQQSQWLVKIQPSFILNKNTRVRAAVAWCWPVIPPSWRAQGQSYLFLT